MSYVTPREFAAKMIDAGESKIFMSTKDTLIRAYMAGAILALAAAFAVTITVNTGQFLVGALLFPVGFCTLYLLGFDLLTGVFTLAPLAVFAKRPGCTWGGVLRNWGLVFVGNFAGAMTTAVFMAIIFTMGFTQDPNDVGQKIGHIGEARTLGYAAAGAGGSLHQAVGWAVQLSPAISPAISRSSWVKKSSIKACRATPIARAVGVCNVSSRRASL